MSWKIDRKLENEERLSYKEYAHVFRDKPEIIALFLQADFVIELIKKWR